MRCETGNWPDSGAGKEQGEEKEGKKADKRDHSIVSDSYYNNST
jgi:hypothetical protein